MIMERKVLKNDAFDGYAIFYEMQLPQFSESESYGKHLSVCVSFLEAVCSERLRFPIPQSVAAKSRREPQRLKDLLAFKKTLENK